MLTRRGFLGTLATGLVGLAATFDPVRALWLPDAPPVGVVTAGLDELRALAFGVARTLSSQLAHASRIVPGVQYARATHKGDVLTIPEVGRGRFEPFPGRIFVSAPIRTSHPVFIDQMADLLRHHLQQYAQHRDTMFVPISDQLRPGVAFSDAQVAVVSEPERGLSVRALRFEVQGEQRTGFEVAVGQWDPAPPGRSNRAYRRN